MITPYEPLILFSPVARSSTTNGTGLDLRATGVLSETSMKVVMNLGAVSGTTPTLDVKIQDSPDNSVWTDISGAAFAQKATAQANTIDDIHCYTKQRYVRAVATIGGTTPSFLFGLELLVLKRQAN